MFTYDKASRTKLADLRRTGTWQPRGGRGPGSPQEDGDLAALRRTGTWQPSGGRGPGSLEEDGDLAALRRTATVVRGADW